MMGELTEASNDEDLAFALTLGTTASRELFAVMAVPAMRVLSIKSTEIQPTWTRNNLIVAIPPLNTCLTMSHA